MENQQNMPDIKAKKLSLTLAKLSFILFLLSVTLVAAVKKDGSPVVMIEVIGRLLALSWYFVLMARGKSLLLLVCFILYIVVLKRSLSGKRAYASVFILGILFSIVFLTMLGMSPDDYRRPNAWGWGAILYCVSNFLILMSAALLHNFSIKITKFLLVVLAVSIVKIAHIGYTQRSNANSYDFKYVFPRRDVAVSIMPMSGLPYQPMSEQLPKGAITELVLASNLPSDLIDKVYAYPSTYMRNGRVWKKYSSSIIEGDFLVELPQNNETPKPSYVLEVTLPKNNFYLYTLRDVQNNNIIFQKPIYSDELFIGVIKVLKDEIGYYRWHSVFTTEWKTEQGQENCPITLLETKNSKIGLLQWDGQKFKFFYKFSEDSRDDDFSYDRHYKTICSQNYRLAVALKSSDKFHAFLFDRHTGLPVADFMNDDGDVENDNSTITANDYNQILKEFILTNAIGNEIEKFSLETSNKKDYRGIIEPQLVLFTNKGKISLELQYGVRSFLKDID